MLTKLKNRNCDKIQKLNLGWNSKTQMVTKLKNSNWDKTHTKIVTELKNPNCDKTWIVTKLKLWQNSNCDKAQVVTKLKLWQNSNYDKTQIVIKVKLWPHSNYDKTPIVRGKNLNVTKLKLWQNSRIQIVTKLKTSNCNKTWNMTNLNLSLLVTTFWHLDNRWDVLWAAFCNFHNDSFMDLPKTKTGWNMPKQCNREPQYLVGLISNLFVSFYDWNPLKCL